jgi:cell division protein FtsA
MMRDAKTIVAIDVGTTKVCTIIGQQSESGSLKILGYGVVPSEGLRKGNVTDIEATERAVRASVEIAEKRAGVKVESAYVGVTGSHVSFENRNDILDWVGKRGVITGDDLIRVPQKIAASVGDLGREVIHALPMAYSLDGKQGIKDPLGMHSDRLEVATHVVTASPTLTHRLVQAVENAGIKVESLVLEPLASSEAVLTREEKEAGVALADIGGGTTDVVVYRNGSIYFSSVIPVGGNQFTNDISLTYNTPYASAEATKLAFAHTEPETVRPDEEVHLPVVGRTTELKVPRHELCQLTRERGQELVRLIKLKLEDAKVGDITKFRLVVTGGGSALPGLEGLIQRVLTRHVRTGLPNGYVDDVPDDLITPAHATGVGILLWAANQPTAEVSNGTNGSSNRATREASRNGGAVSRFFKQMRSLFL